MNYGEYSSSSTEPEANNCLSLILKGEYQEMQNNNGNVILANPKICLQACNPVKCIAFESIYRQIRHVIRQDQNKSFEKKLSGIFFLKLVTIGQLCL